MITIAVLSQKGGSGKTMLARCLAVAFERDDIATAILDMDPQASAALWGKRREVDNPEVITTVLPMLDDALRAAQNAVELVIIDTPPKNADVTMAAARKADIILVPCRPQIDDIETLPATKQLLDVAAPNTPKLVVLNAVPPNPARQQEAITAITTHPSAPFPVCPHTLGHRAAFGDASTLGLTPQEYDPRSKAAEEISQIHKEICGIIQKIRSETNAQTTQDSGQSSTASGTR